MRFGTHIVASYAMIFLGSSRIVVRGFTSLIQKNVLSVSKNQKNLKSIPLFAAEYSGAAGRVVTTPESRWDVLAVGVIESPYQQKFDTPKQATISRHDGGARAGSIKLFPGYEECVNQLDGFDFIWVITYMHLNSGFKKQIRPMPREGAVTQPPASVGLFSSRAPHRPNPIALSALKITSVDVKNGIIHVHGLDLLDGTPVLDIKPYIPAFDSFPTARAGWMDDICTDIDKSREEGYQNIISNRGARAARAHERNKLAAGEGGEGEGQTTGALEGQGEGQGQGMMEGLREMIQARDEMASPPSTSSSSSTTSIKTEKQVPPPPTRRAERRSASRLAARTALLARQLETAEANRVVTQSLLLAAQSIDESKAIAQSLLLKQSVPQSEIQSETPSTSQ